MNAHIVLSQVDPRRVVLLRTAIRHDQVERGDMDIDRAFDDVVEMVDQLVPCSRCAEEFQDHPPPKPKPPRPTPQATIDAVKYCVRQRGLAALKEPNNVQRLSSFDKAARDQLNAYVARLQAQQKADA